MVATRVEIDARSLERAVARIEKFEPKMKRKLSSDIRKPIRKVLPELTGAVPSAPPIGRSTPLQSGVARNWGGVKGLTRTYTNPKPGRAIALIGIDGIGGEMAKYLMITETAGSRNPGGLEPRGAALIRALNRRYPLAGRGGRFVWKEWLNQKPELQAAVVDVINGYIKTFNRKGKF